MTVDNFACSSMTCAIFRLTFTITLQGRCALGRSYRIASTLSFARDFHYDTLMTTSAIIILVTCISIQFPAPQQMPAVAPGARAWYTHTRNRFVSDVKITWSPLTSVESYWVDTAGCRRDGRKSGLSSHHELDTPANKSNQYYFFWAEYLDLEQSARNPGSTSPARSHSYPRMSLSTLPGISRYPSLTASAHPGHSTGTMTSGSIGTPSIDISPMGEHIMKTSDLTDAHIFIDVKNISCFL